MSDEENSAIVFGPFRLFASERRLEKHGEPVRIGRRPLDLLVFLVERADRIVPTRELLEGVWGNLDVAESSLRVSIKSLRDILGEYHAGFQYISNVSGRGYQFTAPLERGDNFRFDGKKRNALNFTTNIPERGSTIIGRAKTIQSISRELLQHRLVTVVGPAGIGKTTVAAAAASALRQEFEDAVVFVDLAPIEKPERVISALSSALGAAEPGDDYAADVGRIFGGKPFLIVLDNCDQFVADAAKLAERLIRNISGAHILTTSRESLRVAGERAHRLLPLAYPPRNTLTAREALAYPAVELFVDRAAAALGGFNLDERTTPSVAEICRRLDGIPLAIELAAARIQSFGVSDLASKLNDMFAILTRGRRSALPRHRTLRATIEWGYGLLAAVEKAVLGRVSVFRAQFTLDAALAVATAAPLSKEDVAAALASLVAKSLLTSEEVGGSVKYRLLEATRLFASERLAESGEGPETARLHAEYNLKLFASAPSEWGSGAGKAWVTLYAAQIDDVRAALDWSLSPAGDVKIGLQLILASSRLWFHAFLNFEYSKRLEKALEFLRSQAAPDPVMEMQLLTTLGHVYWYTLNNHEGAERVFLRALELAERLDDVKTRLQSLWGVWAVRRGQGRYREALTLATRYSEAARTSNDLAFVLLGDRILGLTQHFVGHQIAAQETLERAWTMAVRNPGVSNTEFQLDPEVATTTLLARILWLRGFPDQAVATFESGLKAARRTNHSFSESYVLFIAGCPLSLWLGNLSETNRFVQILEQNAVNNPPLELWRRCYAFILRSRQRGARDALIAAYFEPRLDYSTFAEISKFSSATDISIPEPKEDVGDALWCLPEVLRVNAEILLWRAGEDATPTAEATLLRSLAIAREQSALSWELRSATSLARLWRGGGRNLEAKDLLAATYDKFTEGFNSLDVITARRLLTEWS